MKKSMLGALGVCLLATGIASAHASGGKLLATGGVTSIEGAAGGGLTPWALLSSYAEEGEWGGTVAMSQANVSDFRLDLTAASVNYSNRIELSVAQQTFDLPEVIGGELEQTIYGAKYRVLGDVIYGDYPQVSVGVQYKENTRAALPTAVGSQRDSDYDIYVAASRAWLNGPFNLTWLANASVRATRANENKSTQPLVEFHFGARTFESRDGPSCLASGKEK